MNRVVALVVTAFLFLVVFPANAQQQGFGRFDSGGTCYSWNGGNLSSGSYLRCEGQTVVVVRDRPPVAQPVVQQAPAPTPPPPADKKING